MATDPANTADHPAVETLTADGPALIVPRHLTLAAAEPSPVELVRAIERAHPFPAEWRARLEEVSPHSLTQTWLTGRWHQKAERWVIYACVPDTLMSDSKRQQLSATPYWKLPRAQQQGRKTMVSAFQWEMYRKHRVWAQSFWCLQGTDGGTPACYSEREQAELRGLSLPQAPPPPGALPYAPFDERTVAQIRERDRLFKLGMSLDRLSAAAKTEAQARETEAAERHFRTTFFRWMQKTVEPNADFLTHYTNKKAVNSDPNFRPATDADLRAGSQLEDQFIEHGTIPTPTP